MSEYYASVVQLGRMLQNLDVWLEKAIEHANRKKFEPSALLESRLAPDMYPLSRQIKECCEHTKYTAARLAGKDPPLHPDTETTFEELRARIHDVLQYLSTFQASDFDIDPKHMVPLPFLPGNQGMHAREYLHQFRLPNAYFHFCMAYAILRHNGVALSKMDYVGSLDLRPLSPQPAS